MRPQGISVLIATRDRAPILQRTLEDFCALSDPGVPWELLVVDNGSSDHTRSAVESFRDRLPVRYLYEGNPGKVNALNFGVTQAQHDLIVMTDDDITPCHDWLREYAQAAQEYPECSYFGGPVQNDLSECELPAWAFRRDGTTWLTQVSTRDLAYVPSSHWRFNGANVAYRRKLFDRYGLFDTNLGHVGNKLSGSEEVAFQTILRAGGEKPQYLPQAVVWHRLKPHEISIRYLMRRTWYTDRASVRVAYLARGQPLPPVWEATGRAILKSAQLVRETIGHLVPLDVGELVRDMLLIESCWAKWLETVVLKWREQQ